MNHSDRLLLLLATCSIVLSQYVSAVSYTCSMKVIPRFKQQFCVFENVQVAATTTDAEFLILTPDATSIPSYVLFKNSTMDHIPRQFLTKFGPFLKVLHVERCSLQSVVITTKMEQLYASDNNINKVIVHQTASDSPLTRLFLPMNKMIDLSNITRNLVNLEVLDVSSNERIGEESTLNLYQFNSMPKLTDLILADVGAFYIDYKMPLNLPSLILLDLSTNSLIPSDLRVTYFQSLAKLETLRLQHNSLPELDYADFTDMKSLKEIILDGNAFKCDYLRDMINHLKEHGIAVRAGVNVDSCQSGFSLLEGLCCNGYITHSTHRPRPPTPFPETLPTPKYDPSTPKSDPTKPKSENTPTKTNENGKGIGSPLQSSLLLVAVSTIVLVASTTTLASTFII